MGCCNSKFDSHIMTLFGLYLSEKKRCLENHPVHSEDILQFRYNHIIDNLSKYKLDDGIYVIFLNLLWKKILSMIKEHQLSSQLEQIDDIIYDLGRKFRTVCVQPTTILEQQTINQNTSILLENMEKLIPVEYLEIVQYYGLRYNNKILAVKYFCHNPELNKVRESCHNLIMMLLVLTPSIRNKQINLYGLLFLLQYFYFQIPIKCLENKLFDFIKRDYKDYLFIKI